MASLPATGQFDSLLSSSLWERGLLHLCAGHQHSSHMSDTSGTCAMLPHEPGAVCAPGQGHVQHKSG